MLEVVVGEDKKLSLSSKKGETYIDGHLVDFEIEKIDEKNFKVFKNNKIYSAELIEKEGKDLVLKIDNQIVNVQVTDHIDQMLSKLGMDMVASSAVKEIKAPMPGSILSVEVNEGDEVVKGDAIIILEAMKMENVIKSPGDGVIEKIHVSMKENVEKNQVLISFAQLYPNRMIIENEEISNKNFQEAGLAEEYEECHFKQCDFSNTDLTDISFIECTFNDCDFSNAQLKNTSFKDVCFSRCKMLGLHFDDCNKFLLEMRFDDCILKISSFYQLKLRNVKFNNCQLHEVDFSNADLTNALFSNCDLQDAVFENTILEKADLRSSFNYLLDPEVNYISKARFSKESVIGLLAKYDISISQRVRFKLRTVVISSR